MKQQIKVWGTRILSVVLIIFAAQYWGTPLYKQYLAPKEKADYIPTTKVKAGKFTISFHEIGTLDAEKSVPVNAESGGKIITIVDDGKTVTAGDVIAELDTTDLLREVRNMKLDYNNKLADVDKAKAEQDILIEQNKTDLAQAQAQLDFNITERDLAQKRLERKERLAKDKLVTLSEVEQAELEVRAKKLEVTKGEAALVLKRKEIESKEQQKKADVRNVQFSADMAKLNLEESERKSQNATIIAPAAGLVVITKDWTPDGRRKLQEGDSIRPRQTVCQLPDLSSMQVKVNVGESDAPRVRVGMPVLIRLEAIPNKVFHGTVEDISSLATELSPWEGGTPGKKDFEVTIAVKESDPKTIKPGMTADVEFICDTIKNAIYIPLEAVVERNGKTYVHLKNGKQVQVKTGKYNDNFICIEKGLEAGQVIALRDPTRSLDAQEAGSKAPGADKEKKKPVPIPGADKD